jgi:LacI family transcriptional regulator
VIKALNYRPNALARSLRKHRSQTLGLVVPDITNPFFSELSLHIEAAAHKLGYWVIVGNSINSQREREYIEALVDRRVDGLIVVPSQGTEYLSGLDGVPMVVVDREVRGVDAISSDARGGMAAAIRYLIELGHQTIGCIAGPQDLLPARQRYEQYLELVGPILIAAGLIPEDYVWFGGFEYQAGIDGATALAHRNPRPTAIVASSDQQAIGVLRACADLGLQVPGDVSVVGFDDISLAKLVDPKLTTVRQPIDQTATLAVTRLIERIALAPDTSLAPRVDVLPTELVIRESCAIVPDHPRVVRHRRSRGERR